MDQYTREQQTIRASFLNFIGALITSSNFEGSIGKKSANAILLEEITKVSRDENENLDMVAISPVLNFTAWAFRVRAEEIIKAAETDVEKKLADKTANKLKHMAKDIEMYVQSIK